MLGLSPLLQKLSPYIPDPFFRRGEEASDSLVSIARACTMRRMDSDDDRDDILAHLIAMRRSTSAPLDIDELVSESVTLL